MKKPLFARIALVSVILFSLATQPVSVQAASTVTVNAATTYQTIDGFGFSGAFQRSSIMHGLQGLSPAKQTEVLDLLFSPSSGAGFSILRNIIGSSTIDTFDLVKTIEPNNPGSPSTPPVYVWDGNDADQVWLSQQAKNYGVTTFYADVWSAPAFMKTNNSENNGGALCGVPGASCASGDWRQAYANYLVQYLTYYKNAGIDITYVGITNEPDLSTAYASMTMTPTQLTDLVKVVGATLASSGLSTQLACCDTSNWDIAISTIDTILSDPTAASHLTLATGHGYNGNNSNPMTSAINAGKRSWQTEWSTFEAWNANWDDGSTPSGFTWAERIHTGLTSAQLNAFLYWWGGMEKSDNEGLIRITGDSYTTAKRLWAFANYSRYIRPGATRIAATTANANLKVSAFKNTDGSHAIVILNTTGAAESVTYSLQNLTGSTATPYLTNSTNSMAQQTAINISGGSFTASVPARSLVTYRITNTGPTPTRTPTGTSAGPTATRTRTPTPTRTNTPGGPTATRTRTPTRTNTAGGATATATRTSTATPASNLLTNGNMESGTTGWSAFGGGALASDTSVFHGGARSLLITGRTAAYNGPSQAVQSSLTNGQVYTTNVWVRTQSGTPSAKVTLKLTASSTTYVTLTSTVAVNSSSWTLLSGTATVSWSGTLTEAVWYVETTAGTDSFYIDDASFR